MQKGFGMLRSALEDEFIGCVVRNAACVLAGSKPAALFNFFPGGPCGAARRRGGVRGRLASAALVGGFNARYVSRGLSCASLSADGRRALLLLFRAESLRALLDNAECSRFLAERGYDAASVDGLVACLKRRVRAYERGRASGACAGACASCPFPHEVGVVLGYPLEDVRGFIDNGGRSAAAQGPWKAYGDPGQARARWKELDACRRRVEQKYAEGAPFEALIA